MNSMNTEENNSKKKLLVPLLALLLCMVAFVSVAYAYTATTNDASGEDIDTTYFQVGFNDGGTVAYTYSIDKNVVFNTVYDASTNATQYTTVGDANLATIGTMIDTGKSNNPPADYTLSNLKVTSSDGKITFTGSIDGKNIVIGVDADQTTDTIPAEGFTITISFTATAVAPAPSA